MLSFCQFLILIITILLAGGIVGEAIKHHHTPYRRWRRTTEIRDRFYNDED